ncbi:tRNA modification GTPase [Sporomusaceae bacterium BoRhaA]|nr:tRNA modification GTPase [Pelorhabdus rhamnosifermentans]
MAKDLRSDEMDVEDTISAVATAVGEGGIGIVRVSGPKAMTIAERLFCSATSKNIADAPGHSALYGHVVESDTRKCIDETLLLIMRAPHSYTCEDVVEFQCHGGAVPLRKVLEATLKVGARLAEPGEFTKRAFLNGRIDLTQAEAVMDIIRSKTAASLQVAVQHLSGNLSQQIKEIRQALLYMIAHLEAAIDFPEEDIEELSARKVKEGIEPILAKLGKLVSSAHSGRILREGLKTVIIGKPNVGKSSLLNALLKENRAIVTSIAGTTRDSIEEYVNVQGIPLNIIDTAGIRETEDIVEKLGVAKSRELVSGADLILVILDSSMPLSPEDRQVIDLTRSQHGFVLLNKSDLPAQLAVEEVRDLVGQWPIISLSLETGEGMAELEQSIVDEVYEGQVSSEAVYVNNVRHVHCLNQAQHHLQEALHTIEQSMPIDCIVIDLRGAWESLGEITGDTVGEDLLNQIFSQFCIGK